MRNFLSVLLSVFTFIGCGSNLTISSGFGCMKVYDKHIYQYSAVIYSTDDVWVSCSVADTSIQASESQIYKAGTKGAKDLACMVIFDSDATASSGYWTFSGSSERKGVYHDTGDLDGTTVSFAGDDCHEFPK